MKQSRVDTTTVHEIAEVEREVTSPDEKEHAPQINLNIKQAAFLNNNENEVENLLLKSPSPKKIRQSVEAGTEAIDPESSSDSEYPPEVEYK